MPAIGIIRGFGEGYIATDYVIKLIKALNRRFRSKIQYNEIPAGDYINYGCSLNEKVFSAMKECDCIYVGDMSSRANPLDYTYENLGAAFSNNIEYVCVTGLGDKAHIKVNLASYFDGGVSLRDGERSPHGCSETRVCSTYSIMNIVRDVTRKCELDRRSISFVKDGDNEYCADAFIQHFENVTMPISNFRFETYSIRDIVQEIMYSPSKLSTVFASRTFAEMALGIYASLMKDNFTFYTKYENQKAVYALRSLGNNSFSGEYLPSLCSYIVALCDLLKNQLYMDKEASHLYSSMEKALDKGFSPKESDAFVDAIITELQVPVKKYRKKQPTNRYMFK